MKRESVLGGLKPLAVKYLRQDSGMFAKEDGRRSTGKAELKTARLIKSKSLITMCT